MTWRRSSDPCCTAWRQLREQIAVFDKAVRTLAKNDPTCRLLMSVPGIGVVSVLAYVSTVEDPARFARSRSVGAHIGLTPRQYQSGEVDRSGRISRCGDTLARTLMYEAAVVILSRVKKASGLKDWAQAIAKRSGIGKARVALARKLCAILHSIWRSGEPFRWSSTASGRLTCASNPDYVAYIRATAQARMMSCPPGRGCRQTARVAVGPHVLRVSPLWTLQCLCFGPDVAAGASRPRREP